MKMGQNHHLVLEVTAILVARRHILLTSMDDKTERSTIHGIWMLGGRGFCPIGKYAGQ
jgi:hypothetical protein